MTGVVAVCLTLTSPYAFRNVRSFVCWTLKCRGWHRATSNIADPTADQEALLSHGATTPDDVEQQPGADGNLRTEDTNHENEQNGDIEHLLESRQITNQSTLVLETGEFEAIPGSGDHRDESIPPASSRNRSSRANSLLRGSKHRVQGQPVRPERDATLLDMLDASESSREFAWNCVKYIFRSGKRPSELSTAIFLTLICLFGVFVAWIVVDFLSANIASDKTGLSSSEHCGVWQFDDAAGDEAAYLAHLNDVRKEA